MNENNQLPINDMSSSINNSTHAYCFIKVSCFSSLSGFKLLIDLFNGMDNAKCIIDPPILYFFSYVYHLNLIWIQILVFFQVKMKKTLNNYYSCIGFFLILAPLVLNINSDSFGFICFLHIMSSKIEHCFSFKEWTI